VLEESSTQDMCCSDIRMLRHKVIREAFCFFHLAGGSKLLALCKGARQRGGCRDPGEDTGSCERRAPSDRSASMGTVPRQERLAVTGFGAIFWAIDDGAGYGS